MTNPCHHFVQNAWKKDFCSNCFKSKEEHVIVAAPPRPIEWNASKLVTSILRNGPKKKSKMRVKFPKDISQVIGYGGDYSDSDDFKEEIIEKSDSIDYHTDDAEAIELQNITKENTEFNTVNVNLLGEKKEVKKTFTPLELGKPQTDAEGRKQTLLVSVMPFGTPDKKATSDSKKQSIVFIPKKTELELENKTNLVLTSFIKNNVPIVEENTNNKDIAINNNNVSEKTLLDEIDETLEKGKISTETEKEIILVPLMKPESNEEGTADETCDNIGSSDNISNIEQRNTNPSNESKRIGLSRTVPIKKDQVKPVILQSSNINANDISECAESNNLYDDVTGDAYLNVSSDFDDCTTGESSDSFDSLSTLSPSSYDEEIIESKQSFPIQIEEDSSTNDTHERKVSENSDSYEEVYVNSPVATISNTEVKLQNINDTTSDKTERLAKNLAGLPLIMPKQSFVPESRSDAGEPDGRADSDVVVEPPALPLTPPPILDARSSFLHNINMVLKPAIPEKPKVANKPNTMLKQFTNKRPQSFLPQQQQIIMQLHQTLGVQPPNAMTWSNTKKSEIENNNIPDGICTQSDAGEKPNLTKQDSNASDVTRTPNKRRAPKPPSSPTEEYGGALYTRNPTASLKSDSPVVREKEKRERASSCSPKFRNGVNINPTGTDATAEMPEPAPRRLLSLSQDCLSEKSGEKKKSKMKFSIKKFLRFNTKDHDKKVLHAPPLLESKEEARSLISQPKQRLVIIHPLELNGSGVEVVAPEVSVIRRASHDNISISNSSSSGSEISSVQSSRPLPPPRNTSPNEWRLGKPSRPPPPKSAELLKQQKQRNWINHTRPPTDNLYANLGAIRSGLAPRKPERTASMREREAQLELPRRRANMDIDKDEDTAINSETCSFEEPNNELNIGHTTQGGIYKNNQTTCRNDKVEAFDMNNDTYENQSEREYETRSATTGSQTGRNSRYIRNTYNQRRSDGNIDYSADYLKFQGAFIRSSSMPYCGSETESEIYSPYSFCDSEEGENLDADDEWTASGRPTKTINRLRMRKGRSIVHKNLEDNYGAVIVANHEALAQVLEQVHQGPTIQPALRGLKAAINLRWNDFTIVEGPRAVVAGRRAFHLALWGQHHVTLIVTTEQVGLVSPTIGSLGLSPITEFSDLIPSNYLPLMPTTQPNLIQATISVLPRMHVDTLPTLGSIIRDRISQPGGDEMLRESSFILLQLINGLKILQAQGIEEAPLSLSTFVFCREPERDAQARLYVLQGLGEETLRSDDKEPSGSLCQCALIALKDYLPATKLTTTLSELLQRERAISLSLVKSVLEFALWGPSDVALGVPTRDRELAIQRWLDLERATVLHGLVRSRVQLSVFEESHLLFLVRSSAKMMCEASLLLDSVFLSKQE